jgi:hypothetical protein
MPTQTDLVEAMNDMATTTPPLDGADLLRKAQRRRGRRRALAASGVATGVLAVTGALLLGPLGAGGATSTGATMAAGPASSSFTVQTDSSQDSKIGDKDGFSLQVIRDQRGGPYKLFQQVSPKTIREVASIKRFPKDKALLTWTAADGQKLHTLTINHTEVQVLDWTGPDGAQQKIQWMSNGARYEMYNNPGAKVPGSSTLSDAALEKILPALTFTS